MPEYTLDQIDERNFVLRRDGETIISIGGGRDFAEKNLREYRDQELAARAALDSGDPRALCDLGWHAGDLPGPLAEHLGPASWYFTFCAKIGEAGGTLVFRVAPGPFLYASRTVKTLGSVEPWECRVCGEAIGPK